jgi:XTP/dITP diphosphohydrolase
LRELRAMLRGVGVEAIDLAEAGIVASAIEEDLETEPTFEGNALAKARHFQRVSQLPTIADDSGIEITALGGAPGVLSKRWSGRTDLSGQALDDENNRLLLERLAGLEDRSARYVCAAALCDGTREIVERGESAGNITEEPSGTGGFGYDPYFWSSDLQRTFGEVSMEQKALVSHRARAFAKLLRHIEKNAFTR